jgi:hypothetical protein
MNLMNGCVVMVVLNAVLLLLLWVLTLARLAFRFADGRPGEGLHVFARERRKEDECGTPCPFNADVGL